MLQLRKSIWEKRISDTATKSFLGIFKLDEIYLLFLAVIFCLQNVEIGNSFLTSSTTVKNENYFFDANNFVIFSSYNDMFLFESNNYFIQCNQRMINSIIKKRYIVFIGNFMHSIFIYIFRFPKYPLEKFFSRFSKSFYDAELHNFLCNKQNYCENFNYIIEYY